MSLNSYASADSGAHPAFCVTMLRVGEQMGCFLFFGPHFHCEAGCKFKLSLFLLLQY